MISRRDLDELLHLETSPASPILSVYLNVDQSQAVNLNRGFEAKLNNQLRAISDKLSSPAKRKDFEKDARRVQNFLSNYSPSARTLVIFCDDSQDFLWQREMHVRLRSEAHWSEKPHVRPLAEAFDEYQRYGVILTDRGQARVFSVFLGEIEEFREALAPADVKHFDAVGKDQMRSQMQFQRKQDNHAKWHLKNVADMTDQLAENHRFERLVLGGPPKATGELKELLSERLRKRVVGTISISIDATEHQVLKATSEFEQRVERDGEEDLVEKLITAAAKNENAVTGFDKTLKAVQEGRIRQLVYVDGISMTGGECSSCGSLVASSAERCPFCKSPLKSIDDLVERVVEQVLDRGGQVEQVRQKAADQLKTAGGMGAFLRF